MAFGLVSGYLARKGMVLVDTKTEHGLNSDGEIVVADELFTMDSSRFWKLDERGEILRRDGKPVSFSKEFARGMVKSRDQQFTEEPGQRDRRSLYRRRATSDRQLFCAPTCGPGINASSSRPS